MGTQELNLGCVHFSIRIWVGATYFIAGFFSNGTTGAGGVANEASIASFTGAYFNSSTGTVTYQPEQIPPQGLYQHGYPMFLAEAIDSIITLYTGAAATLCKSQLIYVPSVREAVGPY